MLRSNVGLLFQVEELFILLKDQVIKHLKQLMICYDAGDFRGL